MSKGSRRRRDRHKRQSSSTKVAPAQHHSQSEPAPGIAEPVSSPKPDQAEISAKTAVAETILNQPESTPNPSRSMGGSPAQNQPESNAPPSSRPKSGTLSASNQEAKLPERPPSGQDTKLPERPPNDPKSDTSKPTSAAVAGDHHTLSRKTRFYALIIVKGPVRAQIMEAFLHCYDDDPLASNTVFFMVEERSYKHLASPKALRSSQFRMSVSKIEYDNSVKLDKRQNHLILTGKVVTAGQHAATLPHYADVAVLRNGMPIKVYYNLSARCGAVISFASLLEPEVPYTPFVPNRLEYVPPTEF